MTSTVGVQLGVDVGGTFTDFLLIDEAGEARIGKHLTTSDDPSRGVVGGAAEVLGNAGYEFSQVRRLVHGTTVATNTILTRSGARVGMLTTRGFRDALDIMEKVKYDIYDLYIEYPTPLVPRELRREISERVTKDGVVRTEPDLDEVRSAVNELLAAGAEAIVVCFLHSYKYPKHEQMVADMIRKEHPGLLVGCSAEICPELGEFIRFSTASVNMYIRPRIERYLAHLESTLKSRGLRANCYMMLSTGATADFSTAGKLPVRLIESGPAAGAIAAAYYGALSGTRNLLAFDMGGTTAKACVIEDHKPAINHEFFEVARVHRFKKGSGIPLKAPSIDMIEIGAGGGSIARKDELGFLKVGPDSAESNPGPVCYGRGGTLPTVTDANLVLGYLDQGYFLGGRMRLDPEGAKRAIAELAKEVAIDPIRTAWGIHEVVSENMASAARTHLLEKGRDARRYSLFAFGGSGPVHACRVAKNLDMSTVICALGAGTLSALGLLLAPMAFDFVHTDIARLSAFDPAATEEFFIDAERRGREMLIAAGVAPDTIQISFSVDLRYVGQGYEVGVKLPSGKLTPEVLANLATSFEEEYARLYGRADPDNVIETVNWRLIAMGPANDIRIRHRRKAETTGVASALKGHRTVYFPEKGGYVETPIYDRYKMVPGDEIIGPAIVEENESTAVLIPGWDATIDEAYNLVMRRVAA